LEQRIVKQLGFLLTQRVDGEENDFQDLPQKLKFFLQEFGVGENFLVN